MERISIQEIANVLVAKSGLKKKDRRNKGMIDQIAATLILQTYMNTINNRL